MKKSQIFSLLLLFSIGLYFSCGESKKSVDSNDEVVQLWKQNCALCHGTDGRLGVNGAKDLRLSELSLKPRMQIISKGKGKMIAFENTLSEKEIKDLAKYTFTFK